jgi:hypothetical protein
MMGFGDREFLRQLKNEIENAIQSMLSNTNHSLYYKLYDDLVDALQDTDIGSDPKHKDLIFYEHFFTYAPADRSIFKTSQLTIEFNMSIRSNLGLFCLKNKALVCKDDTYGLIVDIIDYELISIIPELL